MARARVWKSRVTIICPACRDIDVASGYTDPSDGGVAGEHTVPFTGASVVWEFDGNLDRPTLKPSLKLTQEWRKLICHSFVTNGRIQYLGDCTHAMAGQTVDLPEIASREQ